MLYCMSFHVDYKKTLSSFLFSEIHDKTLFNRALEVSDSKGFINNLPLKEDTYLNEKGSGLSIG